MTEEEREGMEKAKQELAEQQRIDALKANQDQIARDLSPVSDNQVVSVGGAGAEVEPLVAEPVTTFSSAELSGVSGDIQEVEKYILKERIRNCTLIYISGQHTMCK